MVNIDHLIMFFFMFGSIYLFICFGLNINKWEERRPNKGIHTNHVFTVKTLLTDLLL